MRCHNNHYHITEETGEEFLQSDLSAILIDFGSAPVQSAPINIPHRQADPSAELLPPIRTPIAVTQSTCSALLRQSEIKLRL
ncbi:hypothetical protein BaRGS_00012649 [Batillaria attramentaria]|uniref:Uncharacterized protein n=1 Tax=Batillaria attramentaria TaxID=370345 RepID=A0ABD0LAS7_9CAEN